MFVPGARKDLSLCCCNKNTHRVFLALQINVLEYVAQSEDEFKDLELFVAPFFFLLNVPRIWDTQGKDNLQFSKWEREEFFLSDLLELNPAADNQSPHYVLCN